jgi:hypothetical protein
MVRTSNASSRLSCSGLGGIAHGVAASGQYKIGSCNLRLKNGTSCHAYFLKTAAVTCCLLISSLSL